jgi:hypothetical protein
VEATASGGSLAAVVHSQKGVDLETLGRKDGVKTWPVTRSRSDEA